MMPLAGAGTPEEASARRWLEVQGLAIKRVHRLDVLDMDAELLSTLLASLPALSSISCLRLRALPGAAPAATRAFLAGAARAIGCCRCLQHLELHVHLVGGLANQLPDALGRLLAEARSLEEVSLSLTSFTVGGRECEPPAANASHLFTGFAGLPRLRALSLSLDAVHMEPALPACVSRLAQLTSLSLHGFAGLRCEPGWARLPARVRLDFEDCSFRSGDGEAALPGMDALAALTSLSVWNCPGLRTLPASLWRLPQLRRLRHAASQWEPRAPRAALPTAGVPAGAPCSASLTSLGLVGCNLGALPLGILAMTRLTQLDLSQSCLGRLPEGVSALAALEALHLGLHKSNKATWGTFDARALGSLASFPHLRSLSFSHCAVLFSSDFQAAAAHPRLRHLRLDTSFPARGPSCAAFLGFVHALLQQRRPGVLEMGLLFVDGAGGTAATTSTPPCGPWGTRCTVMPSTLMSVKLRSVMTTRTAAKAAMRRALGAAVRAAVGMTMTGSRLCVQGMFSTGWAAWTVLGPSCRACCCPGQSVKSGRPLQL